MAILTHGSDLSLAPTMAPVVAQTDGTVRTALERLAVAGFRSVQLDGTLSGVRARDLSTRARQDLLALIARRGMRLAGIDLFLPRKHYIDSAHLDRAMAATLAGIELAADLGRVPLSLAVPVAELADDARSALIEAADGRGVALAVEGDGQWEALAQWIDAVGVPALGAAIDPAATLAQRGNPADLVNQQAKRLHVARLSDQAAGAVGRCAVGAGDLDVMSYRVAVDLASRRVGPVVLDLRGLPDALNAARAAQTVWEGVVG